jgi:hypothetical protein
MARLILTAFAIFTVGVAAYAQAGPRPVSESKAKAAGAHIFKDAGSCLSFCKSRGSSNSTCARNCKPGQCYFNDTTGNYYCVR